MKYSFINNLEILLKQFQDCFFFSFGILIQTSKWFITVCFTKCFFSILIVTAVL